MCFLQHLKITKSTLLSSSLLSSSKQLTFQISKSFSNISAKYYLILYLWKLNHKIMCRVRPCLKHYWHNASLLTLKHFFFSECSSSHGRWKVSHEAVQLMGPFVQVLFRVTDVTVVFSNPQNLSCIFLLISYLQWAGKDVPVLETAVFSNFIVCIPWFLNFYFY